jgi:acetyl esterase/lipase
MRHLFIFLVVLAGTTAARAQITKLNIPYAAESDEMRSLDIYAPPNAKNLPVLFWIHGGGWQTGDKADVKSKPKAFVEKGFVFVSVNYRLTPDVDMGTLTRDVAKAFGWVEDHIAEYGGDPKRVIVAGHSAGAQLSALICIDERWLKEVGVSFEVIKGAVPVDGDCFDLPAIIELWQTRWRLHGMPPAKYSDAEKFGGDPIKWRDFSAGYHVEKGKGIPPFLILYNAGDRDTSAQMFRLSAVLKEAGVAVRTFGAKDTNHKKLNDDLGTEGDAATKALFEFVGDVAKK